MWLAAYPQGLDELKRRRPWDDTVALQFMEQNNRQPTPGSDIDFTFGKKSDTHEHEISGQYSCDFVLIAITYRENCSNVGKDAALYP